MREKPPRPPREAHSGIGLSMPTREVIRLHALAEQQHVSFSALVRKALEQVYPAEKPPPGAS